MVRAGPMIKRTTGQKTMVVIETKIEIVIVIGIGIVETGIETGKRVGEEVEVGLGIEEMTDTEETTDLEIRILEVVETIEVVGTTIKVKADGGNHLYFGTYLLLDLSMSHHYNIRPCRPLGKYLLL